MKYASFFYNLRTAKPCWYVGTHVQYIWFISYVIYVCKTRYIFFYIFTVKTNCSIPKKCSMWSMFLEILKLRDMCFHEIPENFGKSRKFRNFRENFGKPRKFPENPRKIPRENSGFFLIFRL